MVFPATYKEPKNPLPRLFAGGTEEQDPTPTRGASPSLPLPR
jgi:hypothetical protein